MSEFKSVLNVILLTQTWRKMSLTMSVAMSRDTLGEEVAGIGIFLGADWSDI